MLVDPKDLDDSKPPGIWSVNRAGATQLWRSTRLRRNTQKCSPFQGGRPHLLHHPCHVYAMSMSLIDASCRCFFFRRSLGFWLTQVVLQPHFMDNRHVQHWQQTQTQERGSSDDMECTGQREPKNHEAGPSNAWPEVWVTMLKWEFMFVNPRLIHYFVFILLLKWHPLGLDVAYKAYILCENSNISST